MRDIPWEQIKITLFQNKLKDIKKITQGMEKKYKLQLQNCSNLQPKKIYLMQCIS